MQMDYSNNKQKYYKNSSSNFSDEIIIGDDSIFSHTFDSSEESIFLPPKENRLPKDVTNNFLLNYSIFSFILVATLIGLTKIVSATFTSFNNLSTTFFVGGYFLLFVISLVLIVKRKMLTLEVKEETLIIKSFPLLNKRIPINQILRCELNTLEDGKFRNYNKVHFALNENGNRYKQPLNSGISLQLINGNHIIIGSKKI